MRQSAGLRKLENTAGARLEWPPASERLEDRAHRAVEAGDDGLAKLALQPLGRRVGKPGTTTNEQRLGLCIPFERLPPKLIRQLGARAQVSALEMRGLLRLGGVADDLDVPGTEEVGELAIDGVVPFVGDSEPA